MHYITYSLRVEQGHEKFSSGISEDASDHILPEGGTRPCQQRDLQKMHQITYFLRVEQAVKASAVGFMEDALDHVLPEGGTKPRERQQRDLQKMHQITYSLRVEQGRENISSGICRRCRRSQTP